MPVAAPPAIGLAWGVRYADGRTITGKLPEELPGVCPREGMVRFDLLQGNEDAGWTPILAIELAEHENLVFKRRMQSVNFGPGQAVGLIAGIYDKHAGRVTAALYLHGDGTMTLRSVTADVEADPHEVV